MAKRLTNEDLIKNLMNYSPYGGLCQAFITQGLREYAQYVIDNSEEILKNEEELSAQGRMPIVSQKAWVGIAKDIAERMDMFYDEKSTNKLKY
tara:strand:- start:356 stop:634 length:279 start_codon:yes stop_codon:yes gene_type:complete